MRVTLNLDYNICPLDRHEIEPFLRRCRDAGVSRVLWRLSICGKVAYPSRVREVVEHSTVSERVAAFDPLRAGLDAGAACGVEVVPWITLFDEIFEWATLVSRQVQAHPEWQLQDETGAPFPGALCYAEPAVRALRTAELAEVLEYRPPALYLCTRSHAAHNLPRPFPPRDSRSFHPLLDQPTAGLRARAHGAAFSGFLAEVRELAGGVPLALGIRLHPLAAMNVSPWARIARFWRGWVRDGLADELVLGAGDDLLELTPGELGRRLAPYQRELEGSRTALSAWVRLWDWRRGAEETDPVPTWPAARLIEQGRALADLGVGSVCLHEVKNVQERDLWEAVRALTSSS